jgi:hypothetical protein
VSQVTEKLEVGMRVQYHATVSTIVSAVLFTLFRSWPLTMSSLLIGIFVDLDHVVDFVFRHGIRFNVRQFFRASYQRQYKYAVLIFHGWEWLGVLVLVSFLSNANPWIVGLLVGYTHHLILDQVGNRPETWGYSFVWRMQHGFLFDVVFPLRKWRYESLEGDRSWTR